MFDNHGRRINYIRVSITDRCNLRCRYCIPAKGIRRIPGDGILRYEEILRIVNVVSRLGINKVRVTGGEPLVRRDVEFLIKSLVAIEGIEEVTMTTNGALLADYARVLKDSGLSRVNISIDSLKPEKYKYITRVGNLADVWKGIKKSQDVRLYPIKVNVVAIRGFNDDEIRNFAVMTIDNPIDVRFIELMPVGPNSFWNSSRYMTGEEVKAVIEETNELVEETGETQGGPAEHYRLKGALGRVGFIEPLSHHMCETCNRIRLTPDGKLRLCLLREDEIDLKDKLRSGISEESLSSIIRHGIQMKPKNHELKLSLGVNDTKKCRRSMASIGG